MLGIPVVVLLVYVVLESVLPTVQRQPTSPVRPNSPIGSDVLSDSHDTRTTHSNLLTELEGPGPHT